MKLPAKYKNRVYSIEIDEGGHSEDSHKDAYILILHDGWVYENQHEFVCDTKKEVLEIIKFAEQE